MRQESKAGVSKHWNSCQGRLGSTMLKSVGACISGHFPFRSLNAAWAPLPAYCMRLAGCWDLWATETFLPTQTTAAFVPRMIFIVS